MHINPYTPGSGKGYIRDCVFLFFMNCTKVLTLPNLYFGLEELLLNDGKTVECCEYKKETYLKQLKIAPKGIVLHHSDVCDIDLSEFNGVFLDFCGSWNKEYSKLLFSIKKDTNVVITLLMNRESKLTQQFIDLNNRHESYTRLLATFGLFVIKYVTYNDSNSPMCVFFAKKLI